MGPHRLVESFNCAIEGIVYVLKTQRNMRAHFGAAAVVIVLAIVLNLSRLEFLFIASAIFFVLFAEMLNTAIELTIDLVSELHHPLARLVKDIGAGAVMMASVNAIVVGYLIFVKHVEGRVVAGIEGIKNLPLYVTFLALLAVLVSAVGIKMLSRSGTPMRGGMPSAHSAVAFSAATIVTLIVPSTFLVAALAYFLALMVVQGRIATGIHTFTEAILGALFGAILTLALYQLYRVVM